MNLEEKGIETLFAAIGLVTWEVDSGIPPNAPVVLLPLDVEATGAAARDFKIEVAGDAHLNPVLAHILRSEYDIETEDEEADVAEDPPTSMDGFISLLDRFQDGRLFPIWKSRYAPSSHILATMPLVTDLEENGEWKRYYRRYSW